MKTYMDYQFRLGTGLIIFFNMTFPAGITLL